MFWMKRRWLAFSGGTGAWAHFEYGPLYIAFVGTVIALCCPIVVRSETFVYGLGACSMRVLFGHGPDAMPYFVSSSSGRLLALLGCTYTRRQRDERATAAAV